MRDYLAAVRSGVVVFDGGMGATLEEFDLSPRGLRRARRQAPRGAGPQPPGRHRGRARLDGRGRRATWSRPTPSRPAASSSRSGAWPSTRSRSTARPPRSRAARSARSASSRARSARPATCPPPTTRRSARSASASWSTIFEEQARGLVEGGADLLIIETAQDILEVKAAIFGAREAFEADRPQRADPVLGLAAAERRQDAARHRHRRGADDARGAEGRRHRPQLLDRPRGHARRDPLPRRALEPAGPLHPERRPAAAGTRRRDDLPREARAAGQQRSASSSSATASASSAAAAARRPTTSPRSPSAAPRCRRRAPAPRARRGSSSMIAATPLVQDPRRRSSASASTRRARARPRSCCWPTTTTASSRSPRTRSRAARTCSTSASR